jgi:hypothetical protein
MLVLQKHQPLSIDIQHQHPGFIAQQFELFGTVLIFEYCSEKISPVLLLRIASF